MSAQKDLKKIRKAAEEQGWRVIQLKTGHWRYYAPDGVNLVHVSGTPEGSEAIRDILSDLRRYGFQWQGR